MLQQARNYIILILLLALSVFIVPKEFIHSFYGHADTVHEVDEHAHCSPGTQHLPQLDNPHQHCWILTFNAPVYFYTFKVFRFSSDYTQLLQEEMICKSYNLNFREHTSLRGPPSKKEA